MNIWHGKRLPATPSIGAGVGHCPIIMTTTMMMSMLSMMTTTMLMCCRVGRAPSKECPERTEDPQAGGRASKSGLVRLRCGSHGTFLTGSRRPVRSVPCAQSMAMQGDTDSRCTSQHMHPEPEKTDSDGKAHLKEGRLQQLLDAELLART